MEAFHKPLIAIGLSFYEDAHCLGQCLSSVLDDAKLSEYVTVLALDGVYKGYPSKNPLSMDGSREVIQSFQEEHGKDKVQLYDMPLLHERQKRQKYVDIAASQGIPFILILDSDEYIQCKRPISFLEELIYIEQQWKDTNLVYPEKINPKVGNVTSVKCIDVDGQGFPANVGLRPRLWYRPEDMHYTTKHFWFKRKDQLIQEGSFDDGSQYKSLQVENLVIWHDHSCRTQDREDRRHYYEVERLPELEANVDD